MTIAHFPDLADTDVMKGLFVVSFSFSLTLALRLFAAQDLRFEQEPADTTALSNETVILSGVATASLPISYQWFKGTFAVPGANENTFAFQPLGPSDGGEFRLQASTSAESISSRVAQVSVLPRPIVSITSPPANAVLSSAGPHQISATVNAAASPTSVVFYNGSIELGSKGEPPFEISPTLPPGDYTLTAVAATGWGSTDTSAPVSFRVVAPLPAFTRHPFDQKVPLGAAIEISAVAEGIPPLSYQWFHDGAEISGATAPEFSFAVTNAAQAGDYKLVVSNSSGSVESEIAALEIAPDISFLQRFRRPVPAFPGDPFQGIAFGNGALVAVAPAGTIVISRDGINWRDVSPPFTNSLSRIRFLNGAFWAIAGGDFLSSSDGLTWDYVTTGVSSLADIAFKDGLFVAVGAGQIIASTNGMNWSVVSSFPGKNFVSVVAGNGLFVATSTETRAYVSQTGANWISNPIPGGEPQFRSGIAFFKGQFYSIRFDGIFNSPDGAAWTFRHPIPPENTEGEHYHSLIVTSPDRILFMGGESFAPIIRSEDGVSYINEAPRESATAGTHTGDAFYIVSRGIKASLNGVDWTLVRAGPFFHDPARVHFAKDRFYITDDGGSLPDGGFVEHSDGSDEWTRRIIFSLPIVGVAHGAGRYLAVASVDDGAFSSANGLDFARVSSSGLKAPFSLVFQEGEFLATSQNVGNIARSADGATWTGSGNEVTVATFAAAKAGGVAVASGALGRIYRSVNGGPWQLQPSGFNTSIYSVAHGAGRFVAGGFNGVMVYSLDGATWFKAVFPSTARINQIAYSQTEALFLAATDQGLASSWDGINWQMNKLHTTLGLTGVAFGNGRWVVTSGPGLILQTGPPPGFASPQLAANLDENDFTLEVTAAFAQPIRLEASDDLSSWTFLESVISNGQPFTRTFSVGSTPAQFFRAVSE